MGHSRHPWVVVQDGSIYLLILSFFFFIHFCLVLSLKFRNITEHVFYATSMGKLHRRSPIIIQFLILVPNFFLFSFQFFFFTCSLRIFWLIKRVVETNENRYTLISIKSFVLISFWLLDEKIYDFDDNDLRLEW